MKKNIFYIVCIFVVSTVVFLFCLNQYKKNQRHFAQYVITELGGESRLKKKCVDHNLEHVRLVDGKTLTRQITGNDLNRVGKMCDCVIEKSYQQIIKNKKKWEEIVSKHLPDDVVESLQDMLLVNYQVCDLELQIWLNKKYKKINID